MIVKSLMRTWLEFLASHTGVATGLPRNSHKSDYIVNLVVKSLMRISSHVANLLRTMADKRLSNVRLYSTSDSKITFENFQL